MIEILPNNWEWIRLFRAIWEVILVFCCTENSKLTRKYIARASFRLFYLTWAQYLQQFRMSRTFCQFAKSICPWKSRTCRTKKLVKSQALPSMSHWHYARTTGNGGQYVAIKPRNGSAWSSKPHRQHCIHYTVYTPVSQPASQRAERQWGEWRPMLSENVNSKFDAVCPVLGKCSAAKSFSHVRHTQRHGEAMESSVTLLLYTSWANNKTRRYFTICHTPSMRHISPRCHCICEMHGVCIWPYAFKAPSATANVANLNLNV